MLVGRAEQGTKAHQVQCLGRTQNILYYNFVDMRYQILMLE